MAKMSTMREATVSAANKVIVNVLHQPNGVTTMSDGTTLSHSSTVSANHGARGNLLPINNGPILSQERLSALLQSYVSSQLLQASKSNECSVSQTAEAVPVAQSRLPLSSTSSSQPAAVNNSVIAICDSQPSTSGSKANFNVKVINPVKKGI